MMLMRNSAVLGRVLGAAVTSLLVVAAVGLACWFAFSAQTGATLVIFRTGSMAPAIPPGAIAVTLPERASALQRGDVVTVQRANESLPVTHRVIAIDEVQPQLWAEQQLLATAPGAEPPDPQNADARSLTLQGDANLTPDRMPYIVTEVRKAVFTLPYLGTIITLLQTPIGMGLMTLLIAGLVTWAFWPGRPSRSVDPVPNRQAARVTEAAFAATRTSEVQT